MAEWWNTPSSKNREKLSETKGFEQQACVPYVLLYIEFSILRHLLEHLAIPPDGIPVNEKKCSHIGHVTIYDV